MAANTSISAAPPAARPSAARRGPKRAAALAASLLAAALLPHEAGAQPAAQAAEQPIAMNHVVVDERLHTSGQPAPQALRDLAARGFEHVINLAPPTVQGAVAEEGQLLEEAGISYLNIPVDFRNPTYEQFERFSEALMQARGERVLVHCQVNARASTFTFLYRVVHEQAAPEEAYELVKSVWTPVGAWKAFGEEVLARHGVDFTFPAEE